MLNKNDKSLITQNDKSLITQNEIINNSKYIIIHIVKVFPTKNELSCSNIFFFSIL